MSSSNYVSFLVFAAIVVIVPGPDFTVVVKNLITDDRRGGLATALGVASSNICQGAAAALGLGTIIVRVEPLFLTIRWVGITYLAYLGIRALRSAARPKSDHEHLATSHAQRRTHVRDCWQQGFLSNITNPKVLTFYLSVLPQFIPHQHAKLTDLMALALTHAAMSLLWLTALVTVLGRLRAQLNKRSVRRVLDGIAGFALLGFSIRLASE